MRTKNQSFSALLESVSFSSPTTNRYVVFLDIMGFKDRVARHSHADILKDLQTLSNFISEKIKREEGFLFTMFSDSIIILSSDVKYKTFVSMIALTNAVLEKSIALNLPMKGAMACGKCTALSGEKSLYFGQPIIDAYLLEENIELYNVALHHTVEKYAIKLANKSSDIFDYEIKLKGGSSKHYVLGWFVKGIELCRANLKAIRDSVSDSPRRYIDNTIKCIDEFEKEEQIKRDN